ncbi:ParB/RepB/Spo0J family partition protein [Streptomyces sp. NPDC021100]|uniref:ParB/RepB/Spo0J family partition protein n=1 Tax=Streptomyces sp. NPDC021100 TaxID=3365114 RepID=UPI0037AF13DF
MPGAQNDGNDIAARRRRQEEERARKAGAMGGSEVSLGELSLNPRNARHELEGLEGLAETYATSGVLQSVAVIPAETFRAAFPECAERVGDVRFVVIGGNRRLAAARKAGLEKLPVLVNTRATTRKDIIVAAATENLQREPLKPFEELETIEELKQELDTYDAVAKQLGRSPAWVSLRRRLRNLHPDIRQALEDGVEGMTIELARDLGKSDDHERQLKEWKAVQALVQERAKDPKAKKKASKKKAKNKVPKQGGANSSPSNAEEGQRRSACALAVEAADADPSLILLAAMQEPADPDEAMALASHWLTEAGVGASALHLESLDSADDNDRQRKAALALALAHCELHMTLNGEDDLQHAQTYLEWLTAHAGYQPTSEAEEPALTA